MFLTPIGVIHLPTRSAKLQRHQVFSCSYNQAVEAVAWLRGEPACPRLVNDLLGKVYSRRWDGGPVRGVLIGDTMRRNESLPAPPRDEEIMILSSDGDTKSYSSSHLRRLFEFFDDYMSTYPDEKMIRLPYPHQIIWACVAAEGILSECYECLSFLNPKDPLYYFLFNTQGSPPQLLLTIASLCNDEDKARILNARTLVADDSDRIFTRLPNSDLGNAFLAHILEECRDITNLVAIFSQYPSYLVSSLLFMQLTQSSTLAEIELHRLLSTIDFAISEEVGFFSELLDKKIRRAITKSITQTTDRNELPHLLSMMDVHHASFGNVKDGVEMRVAAPYFIHFDSMDTIDELFSPSFKEKLANVFSITLEQVEAIVTELTR